MGCFGHVWARRGRTTCLRRTFAQLAVRGLTEKFRSGVNGKVPEVIERAVSRILVIVDGSLTVEVKTGGLLGLEGIRTELDDDGTETIQQIGIRAGGRQWNVTNAAQAYPTIRSSSMIRDPLVR